MQPNIALKLEKNTEHVFLSFIVQCHKVSCLATFISLAYFMTKAHINHTHDGNEKQGKPERETEAEHNERSMADTLTCNDLIT